MLELLKLVSAGIPAVILVGILCAIYTPVTRYIMRLMRIRSIRTKQQLHLLDEHRRIMLDATVEYLDSLEGRPNTQELREEIVSRLHDLVRLSYEYEEVRSELESSP